MYSAFRKYSDPLHFFLCCSLLLQLFKFIFSPLIYTPYLIMKKWKQKFRNVCKFIKKKKTEISHLHKFSDPLLSTWLKHLWQQLQPWDFLGMMQQALHTWIGGFSAILLCISSQARSGWMGTVGRQPFSGLSRDVRWGSSQGSGWATLGHSQSCPLATTVLPCLCAKGHSHVGGWTFSPVCGPEGCGTGFHWGYLCTLLHSAFPQPWPVSAVEKHPHSMRLLPAHFTFGMVLCRWWAELLSFKHDTENWGSSDQIILFLRVWGSFRCCFANSKCAFMCLHWGEDWVWPHRHKAQIGGVLQWCLSFCWFLPSAYMIMELN